MKKFNYKKAAMFGLDARIALAIFGALSVISGAALYSAIQNSKVTSLYVSVQNVFKAYESLYLDTGSLDYYDNTYKNCFDSSDLLADNLKKGWSGPYLNSGETLDDGGQCQFIQGIIDSNYNLRIRHLLDNTWSPGETNFANFQCDHTNPCAIWAQISKTSDILKEIALNLEKFDDGNPDTGNIRSYELSTYYYLYIKGFQYK
jgi:hypothetical protein